MKTNPVKTTIPEWKAFWNSREWTADPDFNSSLYRDLPNLVNRVFCSGAYFYVIANYRDLSVSMARGTEPFLGFSSDEIQKGGLEYLANLVHPDDVEKLLGLGIFYFQFLSGLPVEKRTRVGVSANFRIRRKQGDYVKVIEQVIFLNTDSQGAPAHAIKFFTDISHIDYSEDVVLAVFGEDDEHKPFFNTYNVEEKRPVFHAGERPGFSERELEILAMVARGMTSKEIASHLEISTYTVNKHRENMMRRTGCKNMNEVINFAHCNSYI